MTTLHVEQTVSDLGKLKEVWKSPQAKALLTGTPQATVAEVVETKTLS